MELALESYDVCVGLLQSKPKTPEGKHYTINMPNLRVDAAISVEEVRKDFCLTTNFLFVVNSLKYSNITFQRLCFWLFIVSFVFF